KAGQEGPKAFPENRVAIGGQRAIGQTVKSMLAVDDAWASRAPPGKFYCRFDRLRTRVGEKHFVQKRPKAKQALGEKPREKGHLRLHEIGKIACKNLGQGLPHQGMIAANAENAPPAQKVQIAVAGAIEQVLPLTRLETGIEP